MPGVILTPWLFLYNSAVIMPVEHLCKTPWLEVSKNTYSEPNQSNNKAKRRIKQNGKKFTY